MVAIQRILICDDHEMYRAGLKSFAVEYFDDSITILEAKSGDEAWDSFLEHRPEIVFLDIEMPGDNGISICKKIKAKVPETVVLIISMHTEKIIISAVKNAQANGYITKGESNKKIAECIDSILSTGAFYSPFQNEKSATSEFSEADKIIDQLNALTNTEKKVLQLALESNSSEEIADILFVSKKSVNNYRNRVCRKLSLPAENNALNRWLSEHQSALKVFLYQ